MMHVGGHTNTLLMTDLVQFLPLSRNEPSSISEQNALVFLPREFRFRFRPSNAPHDLLLVYN